MIRRNNTLRNKRTNIQKNKNRIKNIKLFQTIRVRLIASFMVPVALIILLGIVSFQKASQGVTSSYVASTNQALNMASEYLQFGLDSVKAAAMQYGNDETIKKYLTGKYENDVYEKSLKITEIRDALLTKKATDKFVGDIVILSDKYKPISTIDNINSDSYNGFTDTEFGKNLLSNRNKQFWVGKDTYLDENLKKNENAYSMRLIRIIPETKAILIIDVDMDIAKEILTEMEFDESGYLGIVTSDEKEIVANSDKSEEGIFFANNIFYKNALEGKSTKGSEYIDYKNKQYLFLYNKIGDTGSMICGLIPKSTILSQADSIKKVTIIIVIISILVAAGIAVLISSGIDKTIKTIISKLKIAALGDLTVSFNINSKDEFQILINELQTTFINMKKLVQQTKQLSNDVSSSSLNVNTVSQGFLKSTEDISYAINEIEHGIMQQAKDAEECLNQMDNLSRKIVMIGDNTKEINKITDITKQNIMHGTITTQNLNEQTKETMKITTDIINAIQNLERKSSSISKIINVINEIADKTNLLSLNASIEAARAGEAGRGFEVVASEINKLAEQSKGSVKDIKRIIEEINKDTQNVVVTARRAESVMQMQENAVIDTTESYQSINSSVEGLVMNLGYISENIDNIEEARASTLAAIESISAVLEEIAASSNTVNQTSSNQLSSVGMLSDSARNLKDNANVLVNAVEQFTV